MKLEWDLKEFTKFADNLTNKYKFETAMMRLTQKIAKALHQQLLVKTPVDTGNLRKMWSAGDNLLFTVKPVTNGYEVIFINEATNKRYLTKKYPNGYMYGIAVNDGHKTPTGGFVIGKFFVEASILETRDKLDHLIMEQLQLWWGSV